MIGPKDVTKWADALFDDYLRSLLNDQVFFPQRRDRIGRVPAADDTTEFHDAAKELWRSSKDVLGYGYTVMLERMNRRSRGVQNEPVAVSFDSELDYLRFLDRESDATQFRADAKYILSRIPNARTTLMRTPRLVVSEHGHWSEILTVVEYLCEHPRPGCYVRALPVPVQTKFIEVHQSAIGSLLSDLPAAGFNPTETSFARRCGMLEDESLLRARFLCRDLQRECGFPCADVTLPVSEWAKLVFPNTGKVLGCENKTNFLALPALPRTLAFFSGGGAAAGIIPRLQWLSGITFVYWGDLDPCGLNILAQIRSGIPEVRSVLMDSETLRTTMTSLIPANVPPGKINLDLLTPLEREAAIELTDAKLGIEQERLLFGECIRRVTEALG